MKKEQQRSDAALSQQYNKEYFEQRMDLYQLMQEAPIPNDERMMNMGLFLDRRMLSRFFFVQELYEQQLELHGSIVEFGVRYGQNLALFTSMRGIFEPYNYNRKIIGFDTWEGFPEVSGKDRAQWQKGDFGVPSGYEHFLEGMLQKHEQMAPIEQIQKFDLVKGDVLETVPAYLNQHPETIISLAYFDLDLYAPTKACLEAILPYLTQGAVLGFDEINVADWPGETAAFREVLGTNRFKVRHSKYRANAGYIIFE